MTNDKLPEEIRECIKADAKNAYPTEGFTIAGPTYSILRTGYIAGATAWAGWKAKHDELQAQLLHKDFCIGQLQQIIDADKGHYEKLQAQAQCMADALELIANSTEPANEREMVSWILTARALAVEQLQQFKDGKGKEIATNKNKTMDNKVSITSYTKGEWYLQEYTDAYTNIVRCNNGKGHDSLFIAHTPQSSLPEARANAQLISAAPDLLNALQEIIAITDRDHAVWIKAKAAIEKAIGN